VDAVRAQRLESINSNRSNSGIAIYMRDKPAQHQDWIANRVTVADPGQPT
jgi:hypothetical protein